MSSRFRFEDEGKQGPIGPIGPIGPAGPTPMDPSGNLDLSCNNLLDVSGIYFCNSTSITTFSGECITISGCLDMSCNSIVDVSQVDFCKDIVLTKPSGSGGVAIGYFAGYIPSTAVSSISIGDFAGNGASRSYSIAIGQGAGNSDQKAEAIAIGHISGVGTQGENSLCIGNGAGANNLGTNAIAIGAFAGFNSQDDNTITLNATGVPLNSTSTDGFYVKPIREDPSKNILYYNDVTGEITHSAKHSHGLDLSCSDITDVSNIFFCNDTAILGHVPYALSISGNFSVTTKDGIENLTVTDTELVSVDHGTAGGPAINFGLVGSGAAAEADTGMYRPLSDAIGFTTIGIAKVGILGSAFGPDYIEGLNVGTTASIAGIRRMSAATGNVWEDGHLGNSEALIFTPTDMVVGSASIQPLQARSSQPDPNPIVVPASRWYGTTSTDGVICCQKVVPKGFAIGSANTITIYTPAAIALGTTCYVSSQVSNDTLASAPLNLLSSTTFTTNSATPLSGGGEAVGDGRTIITVYWDFGTALTTTNSTSGIKITMTRV